MLPRPKIVTHGLPLCNTLDSGNQEANKTTSLNIASMRRFSSQAHTVKSTRFKQCTVNGINAKATSRQLGVSQLRPTILLDSRDACEYTARPLHATQGSYEHPGVNGALTRSVVVSRVRRRLT
jgi:hypothetical protein